MQPLIAGLLDLNWSGEMLAGARVYSSSDYRLAFSSLLLVNLAALIATLFLRETHCRQVK